MSSSYKGSKKLNCRSLDCWVAVKKLSEKLKFRLSTIYSTIQNHVKLGFVRHMGGNIRPTVLMNEALSYIKFQNLNNPKLR